MAILGTGRRAVNENGTTTETATPKSKIFALASLVRKGSNFDSPFGGLSPPVSAGWSLVRPYTH
jgi:hypothetical protein